MGSSGGGGGRGGRGGGSGGGPADAGQPGEVFRAAEEAKLQARVDNMNTLVGKLNTGVKAREANIANMERDLSHYSAKNYAARDARNKLQTKINVEKRKVWIEKKRMVNVYERMNKIIDENS